MKITNIKMFTTGIERFESDYAIIETDTDMKYIYRFEYNDVDMEWTSLNDYIEQVKYDFENELSDDPFNYGEDLLFDIITDDDLEKDYRSSETYVIED